MTRYGGIGDTIALTSVARAFKSLEPDCHVTFAVAADLNGNDYTNLFDGVEFIDKILPMRQAPGGRALIDIGAALVTPHSLYKKPYDQICDFYKSVEDNSMNPHLAEQYGAWMRTQNSNYQNWIDLELGWVGIDPEIIADHIKRPTYIVKAEERARACKILAKDVEKHGRPICVQMDSSAKSRSYYKEHSLIKALLAQKRLVLHWNSTEQAYWLMRPSGSRRMVRGGPREGMNNLRDDVALIDQCEGIICMDSGFSHLCEAARIPGVAIYPTIPSWTRAKYYKFIKGMDPKGPECHPCFVLGNCPEREKRAHTTLEGRDAEIYKRLEGREVTQDYVDGMAEDLQTTVPMLEREIKTIHEKLGAYSQLEPYCLETISTEEIIDDYYSAVETAPKTKRNT